jgi:hypothetical protein
MHASRIQTCAQIIVRCTLNRWLSLLPLEVLTIRCSFRPGNVKEQIQVLGRRSWYEFSSSDGPDGRVGIAWCPGLKRASLNWLSSLFVGRFSIKPTPIIIPEDSANNTCRPARENASHGARIPADPDTPWSWSKFVAHDLIQSRR